MKLDQPINQTLVQTKTPAKLVLAAALLLAFGIFVPSLRFGFVHDDVPQIVDNPTLRSWNSLPGFFTHHLWAQGQQSFGNYYRPIFQCWLLLNHTLFGRTPWGWHLAVMLLHLLATWLVYLLATKLVADKLTAAIAALLFAVQPIHIENVAWVSGGVDPLMAVFLLSSALALFRSTRSIHRSMWIALSLTCFALALLTKETAMIFPIVVLLFLMLPLGKDMNGRDTNDQRTFRIVSAILFFAVPLIYLFVRWRVLGSFDHPLTMVPARTLLLTIPWALAFYIWHQVASIGLSLFYDQHYITRPLSLEFLMPLLLVLGIAGLALWFRRRAPLISWLICWFFLFLLPCLNFRAYQPGEVAHDRYLYLPSVAFCLLLAMLVRWLAHDRQLLNRPLINQKTFNLQLLSAGICLSLALVYSFGTVAQEVYYRDNYTLAVRGVTIAPNNTAALLLFARELTSRGRADDALAAYQRLTGEVPDWWTAWYERGEAALRFQRWQEAGTAFAHAAAINPREASEYYLRAIADSRMGNPDAARDALQQGIKNAADLPMFRQGLQQLEQQGSLGPPGTP